MEDIDRGDDGEEKPNMNNKVFDDRLKVGSPGC
jgi:hypothetical protein